MNPDSSLDLYFQSKSPESGVNAPENDDPSLLDRTVDQSEWQSPLEGS